MQKIRVIFINFPLVFIVALLVTMLLSACSSIISSQETINNKVSLSDVHTRFKVKVLGINDFHGQILPKDSEGGMYNLAAHLLKKIESTNDHTFVLHAGDHVGASPAESALLQDEPSISFLNTLNQYCKEYRDETCHVIGTAGNHEFDEGSPEMLRLLNGGNHSKGPFINPKWQGANYKTLSANVVDKHTNKLLLEPYVIHQVNGVDIGFIGLTLDYTPELVVPGAVDNLRFEDQATIASKYVDKLSKEGVEAIIIIVHDGAGDNFYSGSTQASATIDSHSTFGKFLAKLPNEVDLVITGHSHRFTNAYVQRSNGSKLLVTQAFSSGRAYADIDLVVNAKTKDIEHAIAEVILADSAPKFSFSRHAKATLAELKRLISDSVDYAKTYTQQLVGVYEPSELDVPLGEFIANAHQYNLKSDMAIMNNGGVRASLPSGNVTWGDLFAIQPFNNQLVVREYTGAQLLTLIDRSHFWSSDVTINDSNDVLWRGSKLKMQRVYTVGGNAYIMNSEAFAIGKQVKLGELDIDATVDYIKQLKSPFNLSSEAIPSQN